MANVHWLSHVETGHSPHWRAATWSGIIAGLAFLVLEMAMVPLFAGAGPWAPVRMIGAIALGREVLPPPADFALGVTIAALLVHFVLAVVYGWVLAYLIYRLETWSALIAGALFGLALYAINFYGFTAAFPWFAEARNWVTVVTHVAFGVLAAWVYKRLARREIHRETKAA